MELPERHELIGCGIVIKYFVQRRVVVAVPPLRSRRAIKWADDAARSRQKTAEELVFLVVWKTPSLG